MPSVATLYKRENAYYLNWRADGVQHRRSLGAVTKQEAEALRAEKEAELCGLITVTRGVTVGAILTDYLHWYETARPSTYKRAVSALKPFRAEFDAMPAETLPPSLIERWTARQTATGQAEKALKLSRAAFRRAVNQRTIAHSPMDGVSIPKPVTSRAPSYYRPDELAKLAKTPHAAVWSFMVNTGIRRGEMVKAVAADVREGKLYVESQVSGRTKNLRWRAIPLNAAAKAALRSLGKHRLVECHVDTLGDWFSAEAHAALAAAHVLHGAGSIGCELARNQAAGRAQFNHGHRAICTPRARLRNGCGGKNGGMDEHRRKHRQEAENSLNHEAP
jgi:integrase